jgi:hypothetical protein
MCYFYLFNFVLLSSGMRQIETSVQSDICNDIRSNDYSNLSSYGNSSYGNSNTLNRIDAVSGVIYSDSKQENNTCAIVDSNYETYESFHDDVDELDMSGVLIADRDDEFDRSGQFVFDDDELEESAILNEETPMKSNNRSIGNGNNDSRNDSFNRDTNNDSHVSFNSSPCLPIQPPTPPQEISNHLLEDLIYKEQDGNDNLYYCNLEWKGFNIGQKAPYILVPNNYIVISYSNKGRDSKFQDGK